MARHRIRVMIVEDHPIFRNALAQALSLDGEIEVVAACATPDEAIEWQRQLPVDVVIADLAWRDGPERGLEFIGRFLSLAPHSKVIVCSAYADEHLVYRAVRAGVDGYLLKDEAEVADIVRAVRLVRRNVPAFSSTVVAVMVRLLRRIGDGGEWIGGLDRLSEREREVAELIAQGLDNTTIAARLGISVKTVKAHVSHVLHKLGLSSRHQVRDRLCRPGPGRSL